MAVEEASEDVTTAPVVEAVPPVAVSVAVEEEKTAGEVRPNQDPQDPPHPFVVPVCVETTVPPSQACNPNLFYGLL